MDLYEKSLKTLELPAVLEMLSKEAVSIPARDKCLEIKPCTHPAEAKRLLGQTSAAKDMMVTRGSPAFGGVKDVRNALARADMSGVLNTRELLDIAGVLQCARLAKAYGSGEKSEKSDINYLFLSLHANKYLE